MSIDICEDINLQDSSFGKTVAPINRIIPLSTVDGPGSRTSIFLQKCNIACQYCHNPETQRMCINCGDCVDVCPVGALSKHSTEVLWEEGKCVSCDACITTCKHYATPKIKNLTAEQTLDLIEPNMMFIRGITVSGGECCLHTDYLTELFILATKKKLTCLIDTNGTVDLAGLPKLMDVTHGVMLDVKSWDNSVYKEVTDGSSNDMVKKNLKFLSDCGKLTEFRIVVVPNKVDSDKIITESANLLGENVLNTRLKLIAFRPIGVRGDWAKLPATTEEELKRLKELAQSLGFKEIVCV